MRFAHPAFLWFALAVAPLLLLFLWWSWRRRMRLVRLFVQDRLLADLTVGFDQARESQRVWMTGGAAFLLLVALARPQWGVVWDETTQQGRDILVAVDTSRSMLAVEEPPNNRLTKARLATLDLAQLAKTDRFGLIAFAGSAFLQCPLTLDETAFAQNVAGLDTDIIPQGGTAIAEAIDTAIKAFEKSGDNHRVLVLMTDGEDHEGDIDAAIRRAKKAKLRVFTVGVGTPAGEVIRVPDEQGRLGYLKDDEGNIVRSRLNERLLKQIAEETGGLYLQLVGARSMETLFTRGIDTLPKGDSSSKLTRSYREQYYWFVLLAAGLLALEMFWMKHRTPRPPRRGPAARKGAAASTVVAVMLLLLLAMGGGVSARAAAGGALRDYQSGNYTNAYEQFSRLARERDDDERLHFNAGDAAYKAGQFDTALGHFSASLQSKDLALQQKSYFNLGNSLFKRGAASSDPEEREQDWEDAIWKYEAALKLDNQDALAKQNIAYVTKQLEILRQQMQMQGDQGKKQGKPSKKKNQKKKQDGKKQDGDGSESDDPSGEKDKDGKKKKDGKTGDKDDKEKKDKSAGKKKDDKEKQDSGDKEGQADGGGGIRNKMDEDEQREVERQAAALAQMTTKLAHQLLDATKSEEKAIVFQPSNQPAKPSTSNKKDY